LLSEVCEGGTIELYAQAGNVNGNATYEWTGPQGFNMMGANQIITSSNIANNGNYTVTITTESGCTVTESVVIADIQEQPETPTIIGDSEVCGDDFITLSLSQTYGAGIDVVFFNGANQVIGTGPIIGIPANAAFAISPYRAQLEQSGCLSSMSLPFEVTVNELPIATATNNGAVCQGEEVQLFAGTIDGATYEWSIVGQPGVISIEQNPIIYNLDETTTYELTVLQAINSLKLSCQILLLINQELIN